jgi:5-methylcytosine-specific restriction protein A
VFLLAHPLCCMCEQQGRIEPATVVDHITPHKGDAVLFWDEANWQALCKVHHDSSKQREESRGYSGAMDETGWPIDLRHPANRR